MRSNTELSRDAYILNAGILNVDIFIFTYRYFVIVLFVIRDRRERALNAGILNVLPVSETNEFLE
jgi:hypothetical protein